MHRILILFLFYLNGCSSGSGQNNDPALDISTLIGTTWESSKCEIVFGRYLAHSIQFSETTMIFNYYQCDTESLVLTEARPYLIGGGVTTVSGLKATKITLTRNSLPLTFNDFEYTYEEIDYIYKTGNSLYFAGKDLVNNCKTHEFVSSPPTVQTGACTEWKKELDFEQIYYQQEI